MTPKAILDSIGAVRAMPQAARSGLLRTTPISVVVAVPEPAAIAGPSEQFIRRSRNPELRSPARFEPTVKREGDVVL
jgi:hypothetical protein